VKPIPECGCYPDSGTPRLAAELGFGLPEPFTQIGRRYTKLALKGPAACMALEIAAIAIILVRILPRARVQPPRSTVTATERVDWVKKEMPEWSMLPRDADAVNCLRSWDRDLRKPTGVRAASRQVPCARRRDRCRSGASRVRCRSPLVSSPHNGCASDADDSRAATFSPASASKL
jgi:hypothetical protein